MSLGALPAAPLRVPPERAPALLAAADLPTALAPGLADFAAFLACAYLLSSVTLAMGLVTSSSVASHVGPADRVLRPRQGHHGQGRSLHGERGQILGLQTVHIGLAAGPRHHLTLDGEAVEEVVDALRRAVRVEPLAQHRILGRHADGAPAGVAVVAMAGLDTDLLLVVGLRDVLVAVEGHQGGMTDRDGVGAQGQRLGDIAAIADAAGIDQRYFPGLAHVIEGLAGLADRGDAGDPGLLRGDVRPGAGAALHAVDVNTVRPGLGRHAHVVIHARRAQLELDRDLPVRGFTDLLDLERQVIGTKPVRMARGGALVDARGERAHLGDLIRHLLAHQVTTQAHLAALADEELAGIGEAQMIRVETVARLDALIEPLRGIAALVGDHAAFARTGRGAGHGRAARQRDLRLIAERTKAHAGDVDRDVQHQRPLGTRSDDGLGLAFLAIALDHETRERAGQERQVVPAGDFLEQREAAHAVAAELALDMDVIDDLRREQGAPAEHMRVAAELLFRRRYPGRGPLFLRPCV